MVESEQPDRMTAVLQAAAEGLTRRQTAERHSISVARVKHLRTEFPVASSPVTPGEPGNALVQAVVAAARRGTILPPEAPKDVALTPIQIQIARLIQAGATNAQIAISLDMTLRAIKHHTPKIMAKFEAHNRVELAAKLVSWEPPPKETTVKDSEDKIWQDSRLRQIITGRANGLTIQEIGEKGLAEGNFLTRKQIKHGLARIRKIKDPEGNRYFENIMLELIQSGVEKGFVTVNDVPEDIPFTPLEWEIFDLILAGKNSSGIAETVYYAETTIRMGKIPQGMYQKANAKNVNHLVGKVTAYRVKQEKMEEER